MSQEVNFKPLRAEKCGRVLVKQDKVEESTTAAGIIIPGSTKEVPLTGVVVSLSDGCEGVAIGDKVQWQRYRESPVKVDGKKYVVIETNELHGIFL